MEVTVQELQQFCQKGRDRMKKDKFAGIGATVIALILGTLLFLQDRTLITIEEAKFAAEYIFYDVAATDAKLEIERGMRVYEVELDNGLKIRLDAGNGSILNIDEVKN